MKVITTKEVASIFGITPNEVARYTRTSGLPAMRLGRLLRFDESEVRRWWRNSPTARRMRKFRQARNVASFVYFIQASSGPIKIGVAVDVAARLAELQIGSHESLNLLGVVTGDAAREGELHGMFSSLRIRGEWFRPADELLEFIRENARTA